MSSMPSIPFAVCMVVQYLNRSVNSRICGAQIHLVARLSTPVPADLALDANSRSSIPGHRQSRRNMAGTTAAYNGSPLRSIFMRDDADQLRTWRNTRPTTSHVSGNDLLLQACQFNAHRCIRVAMCDFGANQNIYTRGGSTPLMIVCSMDGAQACVDVLANHPGINVNARNRSNETAFHLACKHGLAENVSSLPARGRRTRTPHWTMGSRG